MKAKIQRNGVGAKIAATSLEQGDWFLDDEQLYLVTDEDCVVGFGADGDEAVLCDADAFGEVTPIQVTISY